MGLESSGNLSLGENLYGATRCIRYEVYGGYGSCALLDMLVEAELGIDGNMSYFYGYTSAPPVPTIILNVAWFQTNLDCSPMDVTVQWSNQSGVTSYRIESSVNGGGYIFRADDNTSPWNGTLSRLVDFDSVQFRVRGSNAAGNGAWGYSSVSYAECGGGGK